MSVIEQNPHDDGQWYHFHKRGEVVQAALRGFPNHLHQQIIAHVQQLALTTTGRRFFVHDATMLKSVPSIATFLQSESGYDNNWAAVSAVFAKTVWRMAPDLAAAYVQGLLLPVARVVKAVLGVLRLEPQCEFSIAARNPSESSLRLSLLGPLAMFSILSIARAEVAWDALLADSSAPRHTRPFGWAAATDTVVPMLRFLLLGQAGRLIKTKLLLYSPLARYLTELGLVQRMQIVHVAQEEATESAGPPVQGQGCKHRVKQRLLSSRYLAQQANYIHGIGRGAAISERSAPLAFWRSPDSDRYLRTGRRIAMPHEELEMLDSQRICSRAAASLLNRYVNRGIPVLKRLALWACIAEIDPVILLTKEAAGNAQILASLADAALTRRIGHRMGKLADLNAKLIHLAVMTGNNQCAPFTTIQFGTYLARLREDFRQTVLNFHRAGV